MIPLSNHLEYLTHLASQLVLLDENALFQDCLATYTEELFTLLTLSLDLARERLAELYCPSGQGQPRDPVAMLRSWLLMTQQKTHSPDAWVTRLRREPALAILAGFTPDDVPGATTHRDFLARIADGPYELRTHQDTTLSETLKGRHSRRLDDATEARRAEAGPNNSQSKATVDRLLANAEQPRDPNALDTRLQDLLAVLGIRPTLDAGYLEILRVILDGDGTILISAASPEGEKTCDCEPRDPDCDHDRLYSSSTAQWCKDTHHSGWRFGDRSYTISIHVNDHDLPLITIVGTGNESDFTLAPKALDALLKLLDEQDLPICPVIFTGDGHHDSQAFYIYLKEKGLVPIIPLRDSSKTDKTLKTHPIPAPKTTADSATKTADETPKTSPDSDTTTTTAPRPQVKAYPNILFDADGTPLCPEKCRMRHHAYSTTKAAHYFNCPAMRPNHKGEWIFHPEDCPLGENCRPGPKMGLGMYIKSEADLRLFPPIPRDTKRFKALYNERTSVERSNAVEDSYQLDRAHRNATFGLIRLTFVNICKHAKVRWIEATKGRKKTQIMQDCLDWLSHGEFEEPLPV